MPPLRSARKVGVCAPQERACRRLFAGLNVFLQVQQGLGGIDQVATLLADTGAVDAFTEPGRPQFCTVIGDRDLVDRRRVDGFR